MHCISKALSNFTGVSLCTRVLNCTKNHFVRFSHFRISLNDTDSSPMLSPYYLFYSNLDQLVSFNRIGCLKHGVNKSTCQLTNDYHPPWGAIRSTVTNTPRIFISSGTQVTLEYRGRPIDDYFEISFMPSMFPQGFIMLYYYSRKIEKSSHMAWGVVVRWRTNI